MKKVSLGLILLIFLTLFGCGLQTKTLPEFYNKEFDDVTKITVVDGDTGYKKTITDNNVINEFLGEIKYIKFVPQDNQEPRSGFRYSIALYEGDKKTFNFSLNHVNGDYYHTEPDIYPIVDNFYTNLDADKE